MGQLHMTSQVIVSFFTRPAIAAHTRQCSFPAAPPIALRQYIASNMRAHEHFACYRDTTGAVVALDKHGICVTV
jgi:hypothetical protein